MIDLTRNCAGMQRRDFLQLGIGGLLGLGLTDLLRLRANAAGSSPLAGQAGGKQVNCILIWLDGGPSHYETFDPKPDAPSEIRGEFKAISTSVPGVQFSEVVPNLAKAADKLTIIRSICHKDPNHGGGNHYMMTGAPHACRPSPVALSSRSIRRSARRCRIIEVCATGMPLTCRCRRCRAAAGRTFLAASTPRSSSTVIRTTKAFRCATWCAAEISEGRAASRANCARRSTG